MNTNTQPEVWLRGPIENITPLLQPVAHALLQAREEVNALITRFSNIYLWIKPAGIASAGFHLQHLTGVLDRLFTYANNQSLSQAQLNYLQAEEKDAENITAQTLVENFNAQVERALLQLQQTDAQTLLEPRKVGRQQLPSTLLGLLFHAAEHTQRHVGQLLVTVRLVPEIDPE